MCVIAFPTVQLEDQLPVSDEAFAGGPHSRASRAQVRAGLTRRFCADSTLGASDGRTAASETSETVADNAKVSAVCVMPGAMTPYGRVRRTTRPYDMPSVARVRTDRFRGCGKLGWWLLDRPGR
jgi:hypothetical protein